MAIITLSGIKKSFGDRDLFENVSFLVNQRERVALIGANGTGKTTILRIICGEVAADAGFVTREPGITVGYLPQEVDLPDAAELHLAVTGVTPDLLSCACELADLEKKIHSMGEEHTHALGARYAEVSHRYDSLRGFDYQVQARAILLGLGFEESELSKPVRALSGGQKTRAALARLLLLSPDLLLLDEPTNHLDVRACEWLQEFLQTRYNGAALIVSHDRYFMDQVVSRVIELENGEAASYVGNYSKFAHQKADKVDEQRKLYKQQQKEIVRIEQAIQTLFSHRKFSRRDSKIKQLERIQRIHKQGTQQSIKVSLGPAVRSGRDVVRLSHLSKSYPGKCLFTDASYTLERGRKLGIVGPNGSGKTTLLKIIAEREQADAGEVILGHNVKPVYFAQEFDHMVGSRTVIEELLADADLSAREARDLLARFLFLGDDAFKRVEILSGGELCRLALAKVLAVGPNLLLLDEPTNHLDIQSCEALEGALRGFHGTVMVASHDRYLLDAICNEIVEIKEGAFTPYAGNYTEYHEKAAAAVAREPVPIAVAHTLEPKAKPTSSLRETERLLRDLNKRLSDIEHMVAETEARLSELTEALGDEETYRSGAAKDLSEEYDKRSENLTKLYSEWEQVSEEIAASEDDLAALRPQ